MSKSAICFKTALSAGLLLLSLGAAAHPQDQAPGVYLQAGQAPHSEGDTNSVTVGYVMPWRYKESPALGGPLSFYWDFFASAWRAPQTGGEQQNYAQIGAIANWRWRFNQGESPWFAEAGIGATVMDSLYRTTSREFSTAFQFTEQIGFGRNFGERGEHEVSVRLQHFSNGSIKEPNPGENFWRVRYLYRF
ncbi:acyloxyacyl hydrolase [Variovorax sp. GT1P44]|uniref:acyloxyacyl hydrolase n=1 Tax=Variovorax sp. GT1P44 TaxID=3443742 RepID=UPI003F468EA0